VNLEPIQVNTNPSSFQKEGKVENYLNPVNPDLLKSLQINNNTEPVPDLSLSSVQNLIQKSNQTNPELSRSSGKILENPTDPNPLQNILISGKILGNPTDPNPLQNSILSGKILGNPTDPNPLQNSLISNPSPLRSIPITSTYPIIDLSQSTQHKFSWNYYKSLT